MRRNMVLLLKVGLFTGLLLGLGSGFYALQTWPSGDTDTCTNPGENGEAPCDKTTEYGSTESEIETDVHVNDKLLKDPSENNEEAEENEHGNRVLPNDIVPPAADQEKKEWSPVVQLAVVACGDRLPETLIMFKSALVMSGHSTGFHFHIFADTDLQEDFSKQLNTWQAVKDGKVEYTIYDIIYPRGDAENWRKLFRPCATQRIFLPEAIDSTNDILYVDTDIVFVSPPEEIWAFFAKFNSTQLSALAPEHESANAGWYNRFARHPYYPPLGVNSGVMLMRLDMMRDAKWVDHMVEYFKIWKMKTTWGDQDLINIFFHYFPEKLYVFPCEWNYRPDHCMYMSVCKSAETNGIKVLHGNRRTFLNDKQPVFKAVYEAIRDHVFNDSLINLLNHIKENLRGPPSATVCGRIQQAFYKDLDTRLRKK